MRQHTGGAAGRLGACLVVLMLVASACSLVPRTVQTPEGRRLAWRPILPALHAEPDVEDGGRIVDAFGREVLLRGVNVNALAEYWAYGEFPTTFPLTEDDADAIAAIGWNAVRLLVSWSRVEPEPGQYDETYLDEVERAVDMFGERGIYTIIDFHQDAWGPTLAAPPGTTCPAGQQPAFGWDGAPGWATLDEGASRCSPAGIRELTPAVRVAFDAFWADAPGPGGVGIRTRYTRMLGHVAERFSRESSVAGYDTMNEPNAFSQEQVGALGDFHQEAVDAIRAGERRGGGFSHLVLLEPGAAWSDFGVGTPPTFPDDTDIVFAPHIYRGGITSGPIEPGDFERARSDARGAPVLVGEWGSSPRRAEEPDDVYFRRHQELQDQFGFSATLWTWRESCGDPHKAGEARRGAVPFVWGLFDVDCRTNTVLGPRQALVDQLRRGYVRAAPGRLATTSFDPASGELQASGTAERRLTPLVAWYPAVDRHDVDVDTDGLIATHVTPAGTGGDGVYVTAMARGGDWRVTVEPAR